MPITAIPVPAVKCSLTNKTINNCIAVTANQRQIPYIRKQILRMSKKSKDHGIKQVFTQLVLNVFEQNGNKPLNYKQVAAKLNILDPQDKVVILEILKEEAFKQVLKEISPGKFQLLELKTFVEDRVDIHHS